jgi:hypothetical protein
MFVAGLVSAVVVGLMCAVLLRRRNAAAVAARSGAQLQARPLRRLGVPKAGGKGAQAGMRMRDNPLLLGRGAAAPPPPPPKETLLGFRAALGPQHPSTLSTERLLAQVSQQRKGGGKRK